MPPATRPYTVIQSMLDHSPADPCAPRFRIVIVCGPSVVLRSEMPAQEGQQLVYRALVVQSEVVSRIRQDQDFAVDPVRLQSPREVLEGVGTIVVTIDPFDLSTYADFFGWPPLSARVPA